MRDKITQEFDKELMILDMNGSLHFYKGDMLMSTLLYDVDLPKLIKEIDLGRVFIDDISNPKKSRITLHLSNKESLRYDFHFKDKLRDYLLQS